MGQNCPGSSKMGRFLVTFSSPAKTGGDRAALEHQDFAATAARQGHKQRDFRGARQTQKGRRPAARVGCDLTPSINRMLLLPIQS